MIKIKIMIKIKKRSLHTGFSGKKHEIRFGEALSTKPAGEKFEKMIKIKNKIHPSSRMRDYGGQVKSKKRSHPMGGRAKKHEIPVGGIPATALAARKFPARA